MAHNAHHDTVSLAAQIRHAWAGKTALSGLYDMGHAPIICLVVLATSLAVMPITLAWSLDANEVLMQDKRWYHGDGLKEGDWYTYVVCGAAVNDNRGNCSLVMLNFTGIDSEWDVNVRTMDILAEKKYHNEYESIRILDMYHNLMSYPRPNDFWLGINPHDLTVSHGTNADIKNINAIKTTLFFFGGEVRIGDGYLLQYEPVLGIGEIWSRNADISYTQTNRSPGVWQHGSLSTYTGIRGVTIVTDIQNGHAFCGVGIGGLSYTVSYIDAAKATANVIDGFPFPVSGMATDTGDGTMKIYDDKHIQYPYWYRLVEHSGGHADPDAGIICELAVDMRNTPPEPKPEPLVRELPEHIDYPLPSWFANYTAMPPDDEPADTELPSTDMSEPEIPMPEKPITVDPMLPATPTQDITLHIERDTSFGRDMNTITGTVIGIIPGLDTVALESVDGTGNIWMSFDVPLDEDWYAVRINTNVWDDGSYTIFASYGNATASVMLTVGNDNATIPAEPQSQPDDESTDSELPTTDIPEPEIPIPEKPIIVEPMPPVTPTQDITLHVESDTSFGRNMNTITGTVIGIIPGLDVVALESVDGAGTIWMSFDVPLDEDMYAVRINTNAWDDGYYTIFASYGNATISVPLIVGIENATISIESQIPPDADQEPDQGRPEDVEVPTQTEDDQEPEPIQPDDNADQLREYPEPSSGTVTVVGFDVPVGYSIDGGEMLAIYGYDDTQSIVVALDNTHGGTMTLELPYDTAIYIAGPELDYDILGDGAPLTGYTSSIDGNTVTLAIRFEPGIEDIEIGGSVPLV